jgi:hypothetical protein
VGDVNRDQNRSCKHQTIIEHQLQEKKYTKSSMQLADIVENRDTKRKLASRRNVMKKKKEVETKPTIPKEKEERSKTPMLSVFVAKRRDILLSCVLIRTKKLKW